MQKKIKLSVTMTTYPGDFQFFTRWFKAVKDLADEIVVYYGDPDEKGLKLFKQYHAKVLTGPNIYENFHITKKKANDAAIGDWILQLDTDEVVSPKLAKEIREIIDSNPEENGFWLPRTNYFLGKFLKKGGVYPDYTLRLYRRGKGNLPAKSVHEQAAVEGKLGYLKNDLLHYSNPTFADYVEKRFNHYTDIMAREIKGGFVKNVLWQPLFNPLQGFFPIYFRHLGFLDGFPGFIWALFSALHFPIAYFKSIDIKEGRAS